MNQGRSRTQVAILASCSFLCATLLAHQFLKSRAANAPPAAPADYRIPYGSDPVQFADLRLPKGKGPFPVAVVIHGGCWMKFADLEDTAPLSDVLRNAGIATWNVEFRRVDNAGGGWPGTFQDIATAVDHLKIIGAKYELDLDQVITIGHSAGGHLALWAAARHRLPANSPLFAERPLRIRGAANLAGPGNLRSFSAAQQNEACGDVPTTRLLGGLPRDVPQRYHDGSPAELLPLGVPQILITGALDRLVPPALGEEYEVLARKSGDNIEMIVIEGAGHFEVIEPSSPAWPAVQAAVLSLVKPTGQDS